MVGVESLTNFIVARPSRGSTALAAVNLVTEIAAMFGSDSVIRSDNLKGHTGLQFEQAVKSLGLVHKLSTAYEPWQIGEAEIQMKLLNRVMRILIVDRADTREDWPQLLPTVVGWINRLPGSIDGYSPHELIYGAAAKYMRSSTVPTPESQLEPTSLDIVLNQLFHLQKSNNADAGDRRIQHSIDRQAYLAQKNIYPSFKIDDYVLIENRNVRKDTTPAIGIFRFTALDRNVATVVDCIDTLSSFNISTHRIIPFYGPVTDQVLLMAERARGEYVATECLEVTGGPDKSDIMVRLRFRFHGEGDDDGVWVWYPDCDNTKVVVDYFRAHNIRTSGRLPTASQRGVLNRARARQAADDAAALLQNSSDGTVSTDPAPLLHRALTPSHLVASVLVTRALLLSSIQTT